MVGGMISGNRRMGLIAASLIGATGILPVSAELPGLSEKEWLGHFVGFGNKRFQFGVTTQGKAAIRVTGKKGEPLNQRLAIAVDLLVEEILPDGKITVKQIMPETLESAQAATDKPKNIVFHGKVKGDASFEVFINEDGGAISLGGRLLDPGTLKKNPLRFSIRLKFPHAYPNEKANGDKKKAKAFEDKIKNDRLQLTWTDGKHVKQSTAGKVEAGAKEINGPGIAAAQIEFRSYEDKQFELVASAPSSMALSNARTGPLHEGFFLTWTSDPAKDPEGKARITIAVK